jgi:hypothetical protein
MNYWRPEIRKRRKFVLAMPLLLFVILVFAPPVTNTNAEPGILVPKPDLLSAAEFSRIIREFSEEEGSFPSDNWTSNETSYLHVVEKLRELHATGEAYIGVGPEQNFTYLAKVRPRTAFIIDIRRQAVIQHLLYKAIFQQADSRAEFLALLLSRPLVKEEVSNSIQDAIEFFKKAPSPQDLFDQNLTRARKIIEEDFQFPLNESDWERLKYCYAAFRNSGLSISYASGGAGWPGYGPYPTLADLVLQADPNGNLGNFLANEDDFRFIRRMQRQNRIIPIVGDFAGTKALDAIGKYLRDNGYTVAAFYTSNVEQYLFQNEVFGAFVENVARLPIGSNSVFIRAVPVMDQEHPAHVQGFATTTLLQNIGLFLEDQETKFYDSYWQLVTTHYIAGFSGAAGR